MDPALPPLYARWIEEVLGAPAPHEPRATCSECAMCPKPGEAPGPGSFSPDVKCCTYHPLLPNYVVGAILADPSTDPVAVHGRTAIEARIAGRAAATPVGLGRPPAYWPTYSSFASAFGRSAHLICPYYVAEGGGLCGIWRHRESTCATWFCKHERGAIGKDFWTAVQRLLVGIERALTVRCVDDLDVGPAALAHMLGGSDLVPRELIARAGPDGVFPEAEHRAMFGRWVGREREFFVACADLVKGLAWSDIEACVGPEVRVAAKLAREAYAKVASVELPKAVLRVAPFRIDFDEDGGAHVSTYSPNDPVRLPRDLIDVLAMFEGRTAEGGMAVAAEERGVEIDAGVVRRLLDYRVLEERE